MDFKSVIDRLESELKDFKSKINELQLDGSELTGAVEGLLRLQPFYKQKSSDFASGVIDGVKTRSELSAHDLFVIGVEASKLDGQEYFAKEYLNLALQKLYEGGDESGDVRAEEVLEKLSEVNSKSHDYDAILEGFENFFKRFQNNETFAEIQQGILLIKEKNKELNPLAKNPFDGSFTKTGKYSLDGEMKFYAQICRDEITKSPKEASELRCRLVSNSPYSKIAPFKVEEANLDPYVVIFIDVLSDNEIEVLKNITKPVIDRAKVSDPVGVKKVSNQARVAQNAWLDDELHEVVARLSRRVEDMTGLATKNAERLQVQNYGIAGHYVPHWDQQIKRIPGYGVRDEFKGNRIATMLFYVGYW